MQNENIGAEESVPVLPGLSGLATKGGAMNSLQTAMMNKLMQKSI